MLRYAHIATKALRAHTAINDCRLAYWRPAKIEKPQRRQGGHRAHSHARGASRAPELLEGSGPELRFSPTACTYLLIILKRAFRNSRTWLSSRRPYPLSLHNWQARTSTDSFTWRKTKKSVAFWRGTSIWWPSIHEQVSSSIIPSS